MANRTSLPLPMSLSDLLSRVADYTEDAILITEAEPVLGDGPRIVYANAAFTRMTGYTLEEVRGRTPRLLQGPGTSQQARDDIRHALLRWQPIRKELVNYRKDGSEFHVELSIRPVADDTGWFHYWVSVQRETGERRQFDDQRRLYELILANINQGIVVVDALQPDWPIEFVNAGFTRVTGYEAAQALGRNCRFLQGPESDPAARAELRQAIERGEPASVEILNYRQDGTSFWNLITLSPLRNDQGRVIKYAAVLRDMTESRQREREMVSAQRLKAVGEMTGGIAHDFNNLLTTIGGACELLQQRVGQDPQLLELVASIRGATERGAGQVRRLLGFSRTPLMARGAVDLQEVFGQLQRLLATSLRDNVTLQMQVEPQARWVDAEWVQLEAALLNLLLNGQDAMPGGGTLRLEARMASREPPSRVAITVTDTGTGMDAATLSRVFEPFFTTKAPGRGSGLGLAMVKAFVEQFGGRVDVRSALGEGTCFTLTLGTAAASEPASESGQGVARGTPARRVLLVEDDDVLRMTARAMLESLGHTVHDCADGDAARQVLQGDQPFDLIFTDMLMPGSLDGLSLARVCRQLRPGMGLVLASGWADSTLSDDATRPEGAQFLMKPYTLNDLVRVMAAAEGRRG